MKKTILSFFTIFTMVIGTSAQNVNIPDANFKAYLVGNTSINTNGDSEIQVSEANAFNGTINCTNSNISDLTGVEAFTSITEIYCYTNNINSVDFSNNTALEIINISTNNLSSIDISNNLNLEILSCAENNIASIDVSGNPNINFVNCTNNALTSLNVANGNNVNFTYLKTNINSSLACITVDDVTYSTNSWSGGNFLFDAQTSFSTNCIVLVSSITVQGQGGSTTITTQGGTLQMEATVLPANATDGTYYWHVLNQTGTASVDVNGLLTAISDGTVSVRATANDGSGITGAATITISNQSVGLDEFDSKNISIYPNPVTNKLFVDLAEGQIDQLEIIDYTGRIVKIISEKQVKSIDVSNLTQGIYILKVSTESGNSTQRFIKK